MEFSLRTSLFLPRRRPTIQVLPVLWKTVATGGIIKAIILILSFLCMGFSEIDIQPAIDRAYENGGGTVFLPVQAYYTTAPIILKNGVTLDFQGISISSIDKALYGSVIVPQGHFPAFVNDQTQHSHNFGVKNVSIDYGPITGELPSSNVNDICFNFSYLYVDYSLDNIICKNAFFSLFDVAGGWHSQVSRFWSRKSRNGIWKVNGTTVSFNSVHVEGTKDSRYDGQGWHVEKTLGVSITASSMDNFNSIVPGYFAGNKGLSIQGFDAEFNENYTTMWFQDNTIQAVIVGLGNKFVNKFVDGVNNTGLITESNIMEVR